MVVAIGAWLLLRKEPTVAEPQDEPQAAPAPQTPAATPPPPAAAPRASPPPPLERASDNLPIMPSDPSQRPDGFVHPHPITDEHVRLAQRNALIGALNDALDNGDGATLRRLAAEYRRKDPEDIEKLGAGYEVLADCLERPGGVSRAAAQAYYDREAASTLRRFVRRTCLEH